MKIFLQKRAAKRRSQAEQDKKLETREKEKITTTEPEPEGAKTAALEDVQVKEAASA